MLISLLESKIEARVKQMHQVEDQILEVNKIVNDLLEYRNKLLEQKSELWWECEDDKETIARLKEEYHIC